MRAGGAEEIGANLALLEVGQKDAIRPAGQQAGEIGLAHRQRQAPQVVAVQN